MDTSDRLDDSQQPQQPLYPRGFSLSAEQSADVPDPYLSEPATRKLIEFFEKKGLAALKDEDQQELWYADWLAFQGEHRLYASMLLGLNLLKYVRFLEVFAYFSPAHGYSLQVTFLGFFSILMGSNDPLKQEARKILEAGGLFAVGISEKEHGSDLSASEFTVRQVDSERLIASGRKYYIGNANCASMISILARKDDPKRARQVLLALRPGQSSGFRNIRKIRTLGIRAAYVGEFEVKDHQLPASDIIADGRGALNAVFGTVTLGKFFLGFGSIGICERAFEEASTHLKRRILYGKPVIEMPHIREMTAQAWARLTAMKLYAYRAIDYIHAADPDERRYLLFCAVQKARVGTEGVKVIAALSECIGAKGFESETFFEMALRDAPLIPALEGSTHINLALTAQFIPRYFDTDDREIAQPPSLVAGDAASRENSYLMEARGGAINTIRFAHFLRAYEPLISIANVRIFARQVKGFELLLRRVRLASSDAPITQSLGKGMAIIAQAQLVAESCARFQLPSQLISAIFHLLILDMSESLLALPDAESAAWCSRSRLVAVPKTQSSDWDFVASQFAGKF